GVSAIGTSSGRPERAWATCGAPCRITTAARSSRSATAPDASTSSLADMNSPRRARAVFVALALLASIVSIAGDNVRLIDAVRAGDRDTVRGLLRAKVDVNAAEADGTTALHFAVQAN